MPFRYRNGFCPVLFWRERIFLNRGEQAARITLWAWTTSTPLSQHRVTSKNSESSRSSRKLVLMFDSKSFHPVNKEIRENQRHPWWKWSENGTYEDRSYLSFPWWRINLGKGPLWRGFGFVFFGDNNSVKMIDVSSMTLFWRIFEMSTNAWLFFVYVYAVFLP